jgi:hypothetical protein
MWSRTGVNRNTTDICAELYRTHRIVGWTAFVRQVPTELDDSARNIVSPATLVGVLHLMFKKPLASDRIALLPMTRHAKGYGALFREGRCQLACWY